VILREDCPHSKLKSALSEKLNDPALVKEAAELGAAD
jgi:hypothetical protein